MRAWHILLAALALGVAACSDEQAALPPLEKARVALKRGDGVAAEAILRKLLSEGTPASELGALLGEAEILQGNLVEARSWLGNGDFSDDTRALGFHMLGRLEMAEDNLPAAGQAFDNAIRNGGETAELWVDIGRLRYRGGEQAQAIEASIKAVEMDPQSVPALRFRGQLVRDSDGLAAGLEWFERALAENPDRAGLLADYAATLGDYGRERDMLTAIQSLYEREPANPQINFLQAVLAARAGKFELSRSLLLRSGQLEREMPAAMLLSGIVDIENGNLASAAQTLDRLLARQPDNMRARELLARALFLNQNHTELIHRFGESALVAGASPYLRTLVGRAYEAQGDRETAARYLDLALRPERGNLLKIGASPVLSTDESADATSSRDRVRAAISAGRGAQAVAIADALVARFPGSSDALVLSGDAYLNAGRTDRALERYDRAAAIRRNWPLLLKMVAALERQRRGDDSVILQERYFAGDPGNVEAAGRLGREAFARQDWDLAAAYADHALANGGARDPYLLVLMSDIARNDGDAATAVDYAEIAYGLQPMNRDVTLALAQAYAALSKDGDMAQPLVAKAGVMTH